MSIIIIIVIVIIIAIIIIIINIICGLLQRSGRCMAHIHIDANPFLLQIHYPASVYYIVRIWFDCITDVKGGVSKVHIRSWFRMCVYKLGLLQHLRRESGWVSWHQTNSDFRILIDMAEQYQTNNLRWLVCSSEISSCNTMYMICPLFSYIHFSYEDR